MKVQGTSAALAKRCRELDDPCPDDVCPGCGQSLLLLGPDHQWHYAPAIYVELRRQTAATYGEASARRLSPGVAAIGNNKEWPLCEWTLDHLAARAFRRAYLADFEARSHVR